MTCKICGSVSKELMSIQIMHKYQASYYKCENCDFIQTEDPYWLAEAYSEAIANLDVGLIYRNELSAGIVQAVIHKLFKRQGRYLDYGGGYGMLVRMMRDRGFDFHRYDTYCENLFAKGLDAPANQHENAYDLVTAFEVFEHLVNPVQDVQKMLTYGRSILFSTELQPSGIISPETWRYVLPETGQHIALYSRRSLEILAHKNNMHYYEGKNNFHLITSFKINPIWFSSLTDWRIAKVYNLVIRSRQPSLMGIDLQTTIDRLSHENIL